MSIRTPAVAGRFYPGSSKQLQSTIKQYFAEASSKQKEAPAALVVPHAGYVFSGQVAAEAYHTIPESASYKRVFIIGSAHTFHFTGASVYAEEGYETPIGVAETDLEVISALLKNEVMDFIPPAHQNEHSLEVQVPFIQYVFDNKLPVIPVLIGQASRNDLKKIANALQPYFNEENLFVISTDFSHFPAYDDAGEQDKKTAEAILSNDPDRLWQRLEQAKKLDVPGMVTPLCGWASVMTLLEMSHDKKVKLEALKYRNSGDSNYGSKDEVVGYYAIKISRIPDSDNFELNHQNKKHLLKIARKTLGHFLASGQKPDIDIKELDEPLKENCGAFVSLYNNEELRGCVGNLRGNKPLYATVQEMAVSSAVGDIRFGDVTPEELPDINIEISVLTPLHKINSLDELEIGKHGVYVTKGVQSGTLLPQVAAQRGWNKEELLGYCSRDKAGLGWDGWKDAEVYTYKAIVFNEKEILNESS
ncbi:MAG: AmmeMemoRadiSam system protein B [Bacteroidota bacterium]